MVFKIPLSPFGNWSVAKVKLLTQFITKKTFDSYTITALEENLEQTDYARYPTCTMAEECFLHSEWKEPCLHKKLAALTRAMSLRPSRSLQFLFFNLWASSIITQLQWIFFSSGQSARIISNVVMTTWNLKTPERGFPWGWHRRQSSGPWL